MKLTQQHEIYMAKPQCEGTQRKPYSTARVGARVGCVGGRVGCAEVCTGSTRDFRYQHVGIPTQSGYVGDINQGESFRIALEYRLKICSILSCYRWKMFKLMPLEYR